MIGRAYCYDGREADARRLDRHLWKDDGQRPQLSDVRNLFVHDSVDGMAVMATLKAASKAKIAFWQIIISSRKTLKAKEVGTVVDLVVAELRASEHPLMVFSHSEKPRARKGGGANHLHLVLGHVSPVSFRALDMRHHAPRLHKVMALAAYRIEGVATASPWHKSIVRTLRAEGHPQVADWLVDSLGEVPIMRPSRMTDGMRRSAQAAGFALPSFQASLERLWTTGAAQSELEIFLSENGVAVQPGKSPTTIALFHRTLFVGTLDRILRLDAVTVYDEAKRRYPRLLGEGAVQDFSDGQLSGTRRGQESAKWGVSSSPRQLSLKRQEKLDQFESKLTDLRLERLQLVYKKAPGSPQQRKAVPSPEPLFASDLLIEHGRTTVREYPASQPAAERGCPQDAIAGRIERLLNAESILDAAVTALWQDDKWVLASSSELLRFAHKMVKSFKSNNGPGIRTSAGKAIAVDHDLSGFLRQF
jgi:hypothetical protein